MPEPVQRAIAALCAIVTLPLIAAMALLVKLDSPGGAFFLAERIGANGRTFRCVKLRTMRRDAAAYGPGLSLRRDPRVTRIGGILRARRLDELPQIWNVIRGEMLLVGPRPEDPRYVDFSDPMHRRVFSAKPGITGPTQLAFAGEADLLEGQDDTERHYRDAILPEKLALDARYLSGRSVRLDLWVLQETVLTVLGRPPSRAAIEARLPRPMVRAIPQPSRSAIRRRRSGLKGPKTSTRR